MAIEKREVFAEMDRLDQQQIILAATGEVITELVYRVHGRDGISWAGINHICFFMGDIKVEPWVEWDLIEMHGRKYWSATVRAVNEKYNLASLGTAEAPEFMDIYDRDERNQKIPDPARKGEFKTHLEPDEFCRRKALSMAQRNAKKAVIPAAVLGKWLGYFLDLKAGKEVEPPFQRRVVEAEYREVEKPPERRIPPKRAPEKPVSSEQEERIREQASRDREERLAREKAAPPEEPLKVGPPPREEPPRSVEDVMDRLTSHILGLDEWIVISEYPSYYRVGKRKLLGEEMEYTVDELVVRMGGSWDKEANCWKIPKEVEA